MAFHQFTLATNSGAETIIGGPPSSAQPGAALYMWHYELAGVVASWRVVASAYADAYGAFAAFASLPFNPDTSQWAVTNGESPDAVAAATPQNSAPVLSQLYGGISSIYIEGNGTPYNRLDVHEAGVGTLIGSLAIQPDGRFTGGLSGVRQGPITVVARTNNNGSTSGWSNALSTNVS